MTYGVVVHCGLSRCRRRCSRVDRSRWMDSLCRALVRNVVIRLWPVRCGFPMTRSRGISAGQVVVHGHDGEGLRQDGRRGACSIKRRGTRMEMDKEGCSNSSEGTRLGCEKWAE